ncbi:MAG: alpha/beta hydrolase [Rhodospirillales bacterium]|nr:alpha/beta hydrolase [Rhodospirillales bacterium]
MPFARAGRVRLYYEDTGTGSPIIFVHEFGGDCRSWEPQIRYFSRRNRCIAFNARGYPPSDVPDDPAAYSQNRAADDVAAVLDHLKIKRAAVIGLSQGGYAALHFALRYPKRAHAVVIAGVGYGSNRARRKTFLESIDEETRAFERAGVAAAAKAHAVRPNRVQFLNKDPRGWAEFTRRFGGHSALGSALTLRGLPRTRPSVYELEPRLRKMQTPALILVGDEDENCLEPALFLKRTLGRSGLCVFPKTGHTINLEEPTLFNRVCQEFLAAVGAGRWPRRDRRAPPGVAL